MSLQLEGDLGGGTKLLLGPGCLVSVEVDRLSPAGKMTDLSSITNLKPDRGKPRLAMDQGDSQYRSTIDDVAVIPDEADLDVYVDKEVNPVSAKTPKTDTVPGF